MTDAAAATLPLDELAARLPRAYRARPFEERDREPLVAQRNREVHEMERGDAAEWREWERLAADPTLARVSVDRPDGAVIASADVAAGILPLGDGAVQGGVRVAREHRGKGIGSALLDLIERIARDRRAPRLLSGGSVAQQFGLDWALARGYREIGRRIESYLELASFEPAAWSDAAARPRAAGIRFATFADALDGRDDAGREAFYRALYDAEAPMWEDVPWATPMPHWTYERFRALTFESGRLLADRSILAYDGDRVVGLTTTGRRNDTDGHTWMTGVGREHRGRGIALALKVDALSRAKARGTRALLTTNDEPNRAMRGINARLGYRMLPAHVQLEKTLA